MAFDGGIACGYSASETERGRRYLSSCWALRSLIHDQRVSLERKDAECAAVVHFHAASRFCVSLSAAVGNSLGCLSR